MARFGLHLRHVFRGFLAVLIGGMFALAWSPAASADQACVTVNLSALIGTTCDIGSMQLTFTSFSSQYSNYDGSNWTYSAPWTASDFTFMPETNGFSLAFDGGPQSITAPLGSDSRTFDEAILFFAVTVLNGDLTGLSVTGGGLSATGTTSSFAEYYGSVCDTNCDSSIYGATWTTQNMGTQTCSYCSEDDLFGSPFSNGVDGQVHPFDLGAYNGDSASWDGTPTTFILEGSSTPTPTPEPSTLLMLCAGLLGIATIQLRRRAKQS